MEYSKIRSGLSSCFRRHRLTLPEPLAEKIDECKYTVRSNCIGTALWITGLQESDVYVSCFDVYKNFLVKLPVIEHPKPGCIIAWQSEKGSEIYVSHMGIITSTDPMRATSRRGIEGIVRTNESVKALNRVSFYNGNITFYSVPCITQTWEMSTHMEGPKISLLSRGHLS